MAHDGQIVGHEQIGNAMLLLQIPEQIDNLGLDRDVQGADRLVADNEFGFHSQGAGDADALALAAAEFVRITLRVGALKPHIVEQALHPLAGGPRHVGARRWMASASPMMFPTRARGLSEP